MDKRTDQVNSRGCGKSLWSDSYKEARPNNLKTWLYITEKAIGNLQMSFSWGKSIPSFVLASLWLPDDTWFQNLLSHFSFAVHICTYGFGASQAVKWHSGVMSWVGRDSEQAEMLGRERRISGGAPETCAHCCANMRKTRQTRNAAQRRHVYACVNIFSVYLIFSMHPIHRAPSACHLHHP